MLDLFYVYLPLVKETNYCRKTPKKYSLKQCTPFHSWPPLKAKKYKLYMEKDGRQHYIHIAKQVHVWIALQTKTKCYLSLSI